MHHHTRLLGQTPRTLKPRSQRGPFLKAKLKTVTRRRRASEKKPILATLRLGVRSSYLPRVFQDRFYLDESVLESGGDESVFEGGGDFASCFAAPALGVDEVLLDEVVFL
jgi:hypothetical protein